MATQKWVLDPMHSEVQFKVKHLVISTVTGSFKTFEGSLETDNDDFSGATANFSLDVNSISTGQEMRDNHLKNDDFFDTDNHPQLIFEGDRLEKINKEEYKLYGTLTIRGKSNPVALFVEYGGTTTDPWGNTRSGFSVSGKIKRSDYGISFGIVSETGNIALGDEVKISANAQFVMQKELQPA